MSALKDQIRADLKEAMKAKEKERTGTIRMLLAAIQTAETEGSKHEVDDQEIQKIIAREIKKRRESAEIYQTNGRDDLAETGATSMAQMGQVMKAATAKAAGRADGKRISEAVKARLS